MSLQWSTVPIEAWLASAYCLAAVGMAYTIDWLARKAATSAEGGKSFGGFVYHEDHDAWLCPEDQWLWPQSFDPDNRVMRYRGKPNICNACPVKDTCTTSMSGREVQRAVDSWPASEAARFHRAIACAVVVLGLVWPVVIIIGRPGAAGVLVLTVAIVTALLISLPLWSHLRRSTVYLPAGMAERTLDATELERNAQAAAWQRRRSTYRSDRRPDQEVSP